MANLVRVGCFGGGSPVGPVPDGRTVTPINDVILLQKCAGISSPAYNNLSDLMADTGVLLKVINSDNAIDYLVRSTSFAKSEALVPVMTSNTTPEGECFGSSSESGGYWDYWRAFDKGTAGERSNWSTQDGQVTNQYIGYEFTRIVKVAKVTVSPYNPSASDASGNCKNCKVQYESNGTWYDASEIFQCNYTLGDITCNLSTIHESDKWRLFCIDNWGNARWLYVGELQFYSPEGFTDNSVAMSYIGSSDYASNTLLANSTWCDAICNSTYAESVLNVSVPTMTSDNTPSGYVASANNYASGYNPYKAFDGNDSTCWKLPSASSSGWLKIQMSTSFKAYLLEVLCDSSTATCTVKDSSSNTIGSLATTSYSKMSAELSPVQASDNYTIEFASAGSAYYVYTLQFYGRQNGGVQTWLRYAGITNKSYVTIGEVLNDTTTLTALIASESAMNYLVQCTGWASTICADQTAMQYIGNNNYAADTLLDNSVWCNAIINSTYFASVLNVSVPVMTSNTTPSGIVTASVAESSAYLAFDGTPYTGIWSCTNGGNITYKFDEPCKIYSAFVQQAGTNCYITVRQLEGSNDGTDYTFIHDFNASLNSLYASTSATFSNVSSYSYYRLYTTKYGSSSGAIGMIQYYGRRDV